MPITLDEQAQRAGAPGGKDGRNASTSTSQATANLPIRAESIQGETIMRESARLRRDVAVVQRYLMSLRALNGDRTGGASRRLPTTTTAATAMRPIGARLSAGSAAGPPDSGA
jgi:hypothetical protein